MREEAAPLSDGMAMDTSVSLARGSMVNRLWLGVGWGLGYYNNKDCSQIPI